MVYFSRWGQIGLPLFIVFIVIAPRLDVLDAEITGFVTGRRRGMDLLAFGVLFGLYALFSYMRNKDFYKTFKDGKRMLDGDAAVAALWTTTVVYWVFLQIVG